MNGIRLKPLVSLMCVLMMILVSCPMLPPEPVSETLVPETTKVLDASTRAALINVAADGRLTFAKMPTPLLFKAGDVIVTEPTTAAPFGLLRKVVAVSAPSADPNVGTVTLVQTVQARLVDALQQGKVKINRKLTAADLPTVQLKGAELQARGISVSGLRIDLDTDLGSNGRLQIKGYVQIDPILEFDLGISCNRRFLGVCTEIPDLNMAARLGLNEDSNLDIKGNVNETFEKELELYTYTFSPIVVTVGIPLVFVPRITLYLGTQGKVSANLTFSVRQSQRIVNGFRYNSDSGFEKISERESSYDRDGPNFSGDTDLKAHAGARFQVLLYDAIGPYGEIEVGPRMQAHVNGLGSDKLLWRFEGCLWLNIGVKIDIFTYEENFETNLFEGCTTFAEQKNRPPDVTIVRPVGSTDVFQGIATVLNAEVTEFDQQSFTCQWRSGNAADPVPATGCNSNITFSSVGARTLTLTATDTAGGSTSKSVTVTVKPTPTVLVRITNPLEGSFVQPFEPIRLTSTVTGGTEPYTHYWGVAYPVTSTGGTIGNPPQVGSTFGSEVGTTASPSWIPNSILKAPTTTCTEFDVYMKLFHIVTDANGIKGTGTSLIRLFRGC